MLRFLILIAALLTTTAPLEGQVARMLKLRQDTLAVNKALVLGSHSTAALAVLHVDHDETAIMGGLFTIDADLAASQYGLEIRGTVAQTNSELLQITQDHASSTANVVTIQNDGTGKALQIEQIGDLAAGNYGLYVYSNTVQTGGTYLARIFQDNASDGGDILRVESDGTGNVLLVQADGVLASGHNAIQVYSNAIQTAEHLVDINSDNASATAGMVRMDNDGTGTGFYLTQDGATPDGSHGFEIQTAANQQEAALVYINSSSASADHGEHNSALPREGAVVAINSSSLAAPLKVSSTINSNGPQPMLVEYIANHNFGNRAHYKWVWTSGSQSTAEDTLRIDDASGAGISGFIHIYGEYQSGGSKSYYAKYTFSYQNGTLTSNGPLDEIGNTNFRPTISEGPDGDAIDFIVTTGSIGAGQIFVECQYWGPTGDQLIFVAL